MTAASFLQLDIDWQDDVRYRWRLSRPNKRVIVQGVGAYIANCLEAAADTVDANDEISVLVHGISGGCYGAVRMQLASIDVAVEVAREVLLQKGKNPASEE